MAVPLTPAQALAAAQRVPIPTPRQAVAAAQLRAQMLRHRGDAVECPVCGNTFARFRVDPSRPGAVCWRCGAHERHRLIWLYLQSHPELLREARSLLHFAPEWCLEHRLRRVPGLRYVTGDLRPEIGELRLDITALELPDRSFDGIICSHVLEHVEDDAAAISELHRVLAPGGWVMVLAPIDLRRTSTLEDPAVVDPQERERLFWQFDHVRLYAPDIAERLRGPGFTVERVRWAVELGATAQGRYGLLESDEIYLCRKA